MYEPLSTSVLTCTCMSDSPALPHKGRYMCSEGILGSIQPLLTVHCCISLKRSSIVTAVFIYPLVVLQGVVDLNSASVYF